MGVGLGESDLRRVCVICRVVYSLVVVLGFGGEEREDLTFRGCVEVLAADPGLVVETGPGGVGSCWNE